MRAYGEKDKRGQRADRYTCCDRVHGCTAGHARSPKKLNTRRTWRKRARAAGKAAILEAL